MEMDASIQLLLTGLPALITMNVCFTSTGFGTSYKWGSINGQSRHLVPLRAQAQVRSVVRSAVDLAVAAPPMRQFNNPKREWGAAGVDRQYYGKEENLATHSI